MAAFLAAVAIQGSLPESLRRAVLARWGASPGASIEGTDFALIAHPLSDDRVRRHAVEGGGIVSCGRLLLHDRPESASDSHVAVASDAESALRACRGTFALGFIDARRRRAVFATDRLGVRNVYWVRQGDVLVVATGLTFLEVLPELSLSMDLRAIVETGTLGYPLGDRTPYAEVRCLPSAGWLEVANGALEVRQYRRWQDVTEQAGPLEVSADRLHAAFREAVSVREPSGDVLLGLSGGMDSRLLAATLKESGARVTGINLSPEGSQDRAFARLAADTMGIGHVEAEYEFRGPYPFPAAIDTLLRGPSLAALAGRVGDRVWSGDGGSVGLGLVLVEPPVVAALREGRPDAAARRYFSIFRLGAPARVFRPELREAVSGWPLKAFEAELRAQPAADAGRSLHLALLENDQRRHCAPLWEELPGLRIDQEYPFYDARLLEVTCSVPLDQLVSHGAYHAVFMRLGAAARTPWQTYPGHVPCPVPTPPGLSYQWADGRATYRQPWRVRSGLAAEVADRLVRGDLPGEIVHQPTVAAMCGAHLLGVKDLTSPLQTAALIGRLVGRTGGRVGAGV